MSILLALSIVLEISYLVWCKSMKRSSNVLGFCLDYNFKSSIPQDIEIQLRHVLKSKWKIQRMSLILLYLF